jgi:predicted transcriptional regulator
MLTVNLDDEAEKYLLEILSQEKTTSQDLVKKLLRQHLISQKKPTILERMGGISRRTIRRRI